MYRFVPYHFGIRFVENGMNYDAEMTEATFETLVVRS